MTDDLRVPKRRAQVEVLMPGGAARQVTVFLSEFASRHNGPERLSDLLNAEEDFIPAVDATTDTVVFLNRHGIAAARIAREWEISRDEPPGEQHELEIALVDGTTLRGAVTVVLPPEHARLLDFLNDAQPFVRLAEREKVALVNKRHIARVAKVK
jgi:hypothetical protein